MVDMFYVSEIVAGSLICRRITLIIQKNLILSYFRLSVVSLPGGGGPDLSCFFFSVLSPLSVEGKEKRGRHPGQPQK